VIRRARAGFGAVALAGLSACAAAPEAQEPAEATPVDVTFDGNASFSATTLTRVIEDLLIEFSRDPALEAPILDAAADLDDFYLTEGFPEAEVDYRVEREPELRAVFVIREGPRVTMGLPAFTGNDAIPTSALLPLWSRANSGLLGNGDPYFVLDDLRGFAVAIRARYLSRGSLEVEVQGPAVQRAEGSDRASVSFHVIEGLPFVLTAIELAEPLAATGIALRTDELVGKVFVEQELQTEVLRVREALRNRGYYDPRISMAIEPRSESHTVTATIRGDPGERVRVVGYGISGLERTARSVIESEVAFAAGEWFSGAAVDETIGELYRTGVFAKVEIRPRKVGEGEVELDIAVEELEAREVSLMVGWGSWQKLRGGVFYTDRNFLGYGHYLRLGARASVRGFDTDATWTDPTLFGSHNSLTTTAFVRQREEPAYTDQSVGFSAALSRRLFERTQGRVGYTLESRHGRDLDPAVVGGAPTDYLLGTLFTSLVHDARDARISPTQGHFESVRFEYADDSIGSEVDFFRLTGRVTFYHSFAEDWTLGLRADNALIWPIADQALPVQERTYNGGERSVRSFNQDLVGPKTVTGTPEGGQFFNTFTAELRFPLFHALHGAVFADAGNVGQRVNAYGLSNLSYGIGAGLRFELPIGPVRMDWAVNPDPNPGESDYEIHVAVGYPF
jgi:outer membrane protein insertion porin family